MYGPGDVRFFDRLARLYDAVMPRARDAPLLAGLVRAERPIERVLDLGGGTGRATRAISADQRIVFDMARGMLSRARTTGFEVLQGDARTLPVRDESVDAILVVDALHHMPTPTTVLAEAARVLAPGGVLVIRDFDPMTILGRLLVTGERVIGFESTFFTPDDLANQVEEAGLNAAVVDRGFGYTVVGVKREAQGG